MEGKNEFALDVVSIRMVKDAPIYSSEPVDSTAKAVALLGEQMCELDREVVCVLNLKSTLVPINVHFASMGALNEAMAHPREILKASILSNSAGIILLHCHPSGNLTPSKQDTMLTDRMIRVCDMVGIPLFDHIIVGGDNHAYFSFREKGMVQNPNITYCTDYRNLDFPSSYVAERGKAR